MNMRCEIDGCDRFTHKRRRVCYPHLTEQRREYHTGYVAAQRSMTCAEPGCGQNARTSGLCAEHWAEAEPCSADGCDRIARHGGLCSAHYQRKRRADASRERLREKFNAAQTMMMREPTGRADWRDSAACKGVDPDMFFPERGESGEEAKAVCRRCPVAGDCLSENLFEHFGVFGGLSERERRRMRRQLRAQAA